MADTTNTTAAPAATQPDKFCIDACEEAFVRDFCPYQGSPDPLVVWRAAWQAALAAPAAQEAEPAAWMDPATSDVINSARKRAWLEDFGIGCKTKAETYTVPLYAHPPRPQADAGAVHPDEIAVDQFAAALKEKLAAARAKGRGGWETAECTQERLSNMLREHVEKGDPRDVANFCMFLWARGEAIAAAVAPAEDDDEEVWRRLALQFDGHRMRAIGLLKLIDHTLKGGPAFATEKIQGDIARFLSEPPLSGEEVLAERIARAAAPTQEAEDAARYRILRRGQHWSVVNGVGDTLRADDLDADIDAARARQEGAHHER